MELKDILAISGYSGLFKFVAQGKNGIVVEGLEDNKRMNAYSHYKVSSLDDIAIFTDAGEVPLRKILKQVADKENNQPALAGKADNNAVKKYFETILPDYDRDRVYVSDMKKVFVWYNLLQKNDLLSLCEEKAEAETETTEATN